MYFMKPKSKVSSIFQTFKALVETETEVKIKCLRFDNDIEFTSATFEEIYKISGIKHQFTTPYTPQ